MFTDTFVVVIHLPDNRVSAILTPVADALLDEFMPDSDAVERHSIVVDGSTQTVLKAACNVDLRQSWIIRAIFKLREWMLGSSRRSAPSPQGLLAMVLSSGWEILAEIPDREIVLGTVTCPWQADVVFHAIPVGEFAAFHEPGWVKIAFNLRVDPITSNRCRLRTETRVLATDPLARARFFRYWALVRPGVLLIRRMALRLVKLSAAASPTAHAECSRS